MTAFFAVTLICSNVWGSAKTPPLKATDVNLTPEETTLVIQALGACDTALGSCKKSNEDKDAVIKAQNAHNEHLVRRLTELQAKEDDIMESKPLWFGLGALFTGALVFLVK
jgi:hypothetical protein